MKIAHEDREVASRFTRVPNEVIRNKTLSAEGRILLMFLMSCEDGFDVNRERLAYFTGFSVHVVKTRLTELSDSGFTRVLRTRKGRAWDHVLMVGWGGGVSTTRVSTISSSGGRDSTSRKTASNKKTPSQKTSSKKTRSLKRKGPTSRVDPTSGPKRVRSVRRNEVTRSEFLRYIEDHPSSEEELIELFPSHRPSLRYYEGQRVIELGNDNIYRVRG